MGRGALQKPGKPANGPSFSGVRGGKVQKQRKKHKVVLETAGDKDDDDKLRVVVSGGRSALRHDVAYNY